MSLVLNNRSLLEYWENQQTSITQEIDTDHIIIKQNTGPKVIKVFSCSSQLSMKFQMLIHIKILRNSFFLGSDKHRMLVYPAHKCKMLTIVGILHL